MSKPVREVLLDLYILWKDALQNRKGIGATILGLLAIIVAVAIIYLMVKIIAIVLPILTSLTLITVIIIVSIATLLPLVARYSVGSLTFAKYKDKYITLDNTSYNYTFTDTNDNSNNQDNQKNFTIFNLSTINANIYIKFDRELSSPSLELLLTEGEAKNLIFLIKEEDNCLSFTQAPINLNTQKLAYDLSLTLPESYANLSLAGRMIEGKLHIYGDSKIDSLKIETTNSLLEIEKSTINYGRVYGLNLLLSFENVVFNDFAIRGTGSNLKFNFSDTNRGLSLKIPNVNTLTGYSFNKESVSKKFTHNRQNIVWNGKGEEKAMNLEISVIGANVEINNSELN